LLSSFFLRLGHYGKPSVYREYPLSTHIDFVQGYLPGLQSHRNIDETCLAPRGNKHP
jgi:hypothetical protein